MSLTITYPYRNTPNAGTQSKWFAAHSPIIIKAERKDDVVVSTGNNGGNVQITYTTATVLVVGQYVYIKSGTIDGTYQILSIASTTVCTINLAYSAVTAGGFINFTSARANYYIHTRVQIWDVGIAGFVDFDSTKTSPFTNGIVKIDLTRIAKNSVNMTDSFTHSVLNVKDTNLSSQLHTIFTEVWEGSSELELDADDLYIVNAAMQIGHRFGSNMADFMPIDAHPDDLAKWLSASSKLRFWNNLPFDLSVILPALAETVKIEDVRYFDATAIGGGLNPLDNAQKGWVNRVMLQGPYASNINRLRVFLVDSPDEDHYTEELEVRIMCTPKNPVYLKWINANGGWNYFCFGTKQLRGLKTKTLAEFSKFYEDISLQESDSEYLGKEATPELALFAERLDTYDIELMESLISSPKVMYLTNIDTWEATAEIWHTVKVEPGTIPTRNTRNVFNKIEFKMLLPELNIQTQ